MNRLIYIPTFLFLFSCQNGNQNSESKSVDKVTDSLNSTLNTIENRQSKVENRPTRKNKNQSNYLEILKNYLLKGAEGDPELTALINENGDVEIDRSDGNFLSVYGLKDAQIYEGHWDGQIKSGAIVVITNEGGGGGGNVGVIENYVIDDDGGVSVIDTEITNAPKNKYGYEIYITGISDHYVRINFIFRNENDGFYAQGKVLPLKCKLINYKLQVEN